MDLATSAADPPFSPTTSSQTAKALQDTAFGSIAGILGKIIEYPFDTVKVRLQSQPSSFPLRYTGPLDCFRQSISQDGLLSLYRGISAPLFGAAIETSSLFFSYRIAQELVKSTFYGRVGEDEKLSLGPLVLCGAASGAFTSLFLTPIELVKCQMQIPSSTSSKGTAGPLSIITSVVRHHGLFGFWYGQLGTFIRETGGSAAWFGSYEAVCALFKRYNATGDSGEPKLHFHQRLLAGAVAGMSYNFVCFPADTIKSRMQTAEVVPGRKNGRLKFWATGGALWKQQGLKGMYRGCGITVARAAPSSAVIFAVEEGLQSWWNDREHGQLMKGKQV